MKRELSPLRVSPFGRLFTCYTVNQLGDFVGIVALALLVYNETRDPFATSALFASMEFLPAFAAPVLTARLDQLPPRAVLPALFFAEAALFAILGLLAESFVLWAVLLVAFLDGVLMLSARGLIRGVINETLEPSGLLREGNGLVNVGFALASVLGASLGGVLVGAFSPAVALYIDAASFAAVGLLLLTAPTLRSMQDTPREPLWPRLASGLRFARTDRVVRLLLSCQTLAILLFTMVVPIEVVYAKETLQTTDAGYGLLLASWGAGAVLGSIAYVRLARGSLVGLIVLSTAMIGVAYVGMGLSELLSTATICSAIGGFGNGIQWVAVMTALQEATPGDLQSRIAGLLESSASAVMGVGFIAGGTLATVTAPETCFLVAGTGTLALVATGLLLARRARLRPPARAA